MYKNYEISSRSTIRDFYAGKHVLITGGTGFMGKVLVEKLLRSCPDIGAVYVLVRPKKGKNAQERVLELTKVPLFERLRTNGGTQLLKLTAISGDTLSPTLDLSNDDMQLMRDNVHIVFHMAANVRFDQSLKGALYQNAGGTLAMLRFAETFHRLQAFVHVSTSYCHCDQRVLEEKVYPVPHNPRKMLDLVSWMEDDYIRLLTPALLQNAPNTYSYTKCLTEQLVSEYAKRMPVAIARPSIVMGSVKEPLPGWIDNFNGPVGLLIGAGKGVVRSMYGNGNLNVDLVPVDVTIKGLLLVGRETYERNILHNDGPLVINLTSGQDNQITWGDLIDISKKHYLKNPFSVCLWYPGGSIKTSYIWHMLCVFFCHVIPAYLIDLVMIITWQKPFLVRTQKRIQGGLHILQYYTGRPWYFRNDKIKKLSAQLVDEERKDFAVDYFDIDWNRYIYDMVLGARTYCLKERPETIPQAKKLLRKLYFLDMGVNILCGLVAIGTLLYLTTSYIV